MPAIALNGESFQVADTGDGPPLLLVHGFPLAHAMWAAQMKALSHDHRVIAPDLRGFGGSVVTPGTVTMARMADDLAGLLDALDVDGAVAYAGFSMGGYVGWEFLRRHRERVASLVLCDTRVGADTPEAAAGRRKLADRVEAEGADVAVEAMLPKLLAADHADRDPHLADTVASMIRRSDPRGIAAALRGMAERRDSRDLLSGLAELPVLVIVGERDVISTADEMAGLAAAIPGASFRKIANAGHTTPMEAPDAVSEALNEFLGAPTR